MMHLGANLELSYCCSEALALVINHVVASPRGGDAARVLSREDNRYEQTSDFIVI